MSPMRWCPVLLVALLVAGRTCSASTVVVPDQYATIQAALDARPDSILVRPGLHDAALRVEWGVALMRHPDAPSTDLPVVGTIRVESRDYWGNPQIRITGIHATRRVIAGRVGLLRLASCTLDSALTGRGPSSGNATVEVTDCRIGGPVELIEYHDGFVSGCTVTGSVRLRCYGDGWVAGCTVSGGGIGVFTEGTYADISGNVVTGPGAFGVGCSTLGWSSSASGNHVSGFDVGISIGSAEGSVWITGNEVERCSVDAIQGNWDRRCTLSNNFVHDCGGDGMDLSSFEGTVSHNRIEDVAGAGMRITGRWEPVVIVANRIARTGAEGIVVDRARLRDNVVLRAGRDGASLGGWVDSVVGNVFGRCGGSGLTVGVQAGRAALLRNTSYSNAGNGIVARSQYAIDTTRIQGNIAFGNGGCGLLASGPGAALPSCNDWFGNSGGATSGVPVGATDLQVDPMFCDLALDDVHHVDSASPLLGAACGPIGAIEVGCATVQALLLGGEKDAIVVAGQPGRVMLAMLGHATVRPQDVDLATVRFASAPLAIGDDGLPRAEIRDMNRDGIPELVMWFEQQALQIEPGPVSARLEARTRAGVRLVATVPLAAIERPGRRDPLGGDEVERPLVLSIAPLANPSVGDRLLVRLTLPTSAPARLDVVDVAGRRVSTMRLDAAPGERTIELSTGSAMPSGIYFLRVAQAGRIVTRRVVRL